MTQATAFIHEFEVDENDNEVWIILDCIDELQESFEIEMKLSLDDLEDLELEGGEEYVIRLSELPEDNSFIGQVFFSLPQEEQKETQLFVTFNRRF